MTSVNTRYSSRIAPLALAGVIVLGACGSDDNPGSADGDTVPPATDGPLAPIPVRTAGGGSQGGGVATAEAASDSRMATDMMMPFRITNFVVADGLPALPTNDLGYVFQMGAAVTPEQVSALAASLGVTGEPVRIDEGYGVSWRVGPDDGSAPSVWVYEDAQLSWNYSSAWALTPGYAGCAVAESPPSDGSVVEPAAGDDTGGVSERTVVEECVEPAPPVGVPDAADAEARTRELMAALDLDPAAFTFEPYADEWSANVSAVEQLGELFTGRRVDVSFGAEGVMQYAGGQLAEPQQVGPYPLIGLDEAVERLRDQSGFYGGGIVTSDMARTAVGGDVAVSSDDVAAEPGVSESGVAEPGVIEPGVSEPVPVDTVPLEEVTVTLVDVQADIWWTMDVDGSVFLLPAYRFIGDDGGWYTVPAVTDDYLVQVESDVIPLPEPMPVESVPVETAPVEGMPVESVPVEIAPVETKPEVLPTESIPGEQTALDTTLLEPAVGTTLAEFTAAAEAIGATVRVTEIDGEPQAVTMDYRFDRVNVAVTGEGDAATVTAILGVG
jgi:hypothetical protein